MSKSWWGSLFRSLADAVSTDDQPALELTSAPLNPGISSFGLVLPHWSSLLEQPKVMPQRSESALPASNVRELPQLQTPAAPAPEPSAAPMHETPEKTSFAFPETKILPVPLAAIQVDADELYPLVHQFKDSLARSRRREVIWVSFISVEAIVLLCRYLGLF